MAGRLKIQAIRLIVPSIWLNRREKTKRPHLVTARRLSRRTEINYDNRAGLIGHVLNCCQQFEVRASLRKYICGYLVRPDPFKCVGCLIPLEVDIVLSKTLNSLDCSP